MLNIVGRASTASPLSLSRTGQPFLPLLGAIRSASCCPLHTVAPYAERANVRGYPARELPITAWCRRSGQIERSCLASPTLCPSPFCACIAIRHDYMDSLPSLSIRNIFNTSSRLSCITQASKATTRLTEHTALPLGAFGCS